MKLFCVFFFSVALCMSSLSQKDNHSNYLIKFSPTQLFAGEFHFEFEREVASQLSVVVNGGPTMSEVGIPRINDYGFRYDPILYGGSRSSDIGGFVGVGLRFYPLKNYATAVRALYFGPEFKYRVYNTELSFNDNMTPPPSYDSKFRVTQYTFRFQIGYLFRIGSSFGIELYTNIGIGQAQMYANSLIDIYDVTTNSYYYEPMEDREKRIYVAGTWGVKFGFGSAKRN